MDQNQTLPHVHSIKQQHLCLHFLPEHSWIPQKHIGLTIIPWTAEWLYHYEIWLVTGNWNGGGIEHMPTKSTA